MTAAPDGPLAFADAKAWAAWLKREHASSDGVWVRLYKKDSGVPSLSHAEALDEALCWGWIDGQLKPLDARSWLRRFTPRRPRSAWSKRNREHIARLEREGRLRAPGRAQVEAAQADGRWERAYDAPSQAGLPADVLQALAGFPRARAFLDSPNQANRYAISYRLQTAKKPETRRRRLERIVAMLKAGERFH